MARPRKIKSPAEMDRLVDGYVEQQRAGGKPILLMGLILHLGLSGREALDNYERRSEFLDSVKRAKAIVAHCYEERLHEQAPAGAIFALKNFGWTDRQDVRHSGDADNPVVVEGRIKLVRPADQA